MTRTAKVMAVLVGTALVFVLGTGILVAGTTVASGLMTVSIHEEGPDGLDLFIPVPAGLVEATLELAPLAFKVAGHHGLDHEFDHVRGEIEDMLPALDAMLAHLHEMPDAVLVEVESDREFVRVSKKRGSILIRVEEHGNRIEIAIPTRVFRSVSGFLAG